jgi:hypothetical protein
MAIVKFSTLPTLFNNENLLIGADFHTIPPVDIVGAAEHEGDRPVTAQVVERVQQRHVRPAHLRV